MKILTWITFNCRVKIYNEFICQSTSPEVSKELVNHVLDFVNCPDKILKQNFNSSFKQSISLSCSILFEYNFSALVSCEPMVGSY